MRIRYIKPSICSNEDLAELGPYAYILFTGLWMLADREGRFEYRPKRIKALVMPLWDDVTPEIIEEIIAGLCKRGMLALYDFHNRTYGEILNWRKHQRPDPREARSDIPGPASASPAATPVTAHSGITLSTHCNSSVETGGILDLGSGLSGERTNPAHAVENSPPPPPREETPERKPPTRELRRASIRVDSEPIQVESEYIRNRPGSSGELPPRDRGPVDFWPHKPDDVATVKESLSALGRYVGMKPPDDALVRQVLDVASGKSGDEIHAALIALHKRDKFRAMYSWGFVPHLLRESLRASVAA